MLQHTLKLTPKRLIEVSEFMLAILKILEKMHNNTNIHANVNDDLNY